MEGALPSLEETEGGPFTPQTVLLRLEADRGSEPYPTPFSCAWRSLHLILEFHYRSAESIPLFRRRGDYGEHL